MKDTKDTVQFWSYPDGIAKTLGQDDFVLVRNKLGSLDTKFVADLIPNDYYCQRIPEPLPQRNAEDILKYIYDNKLSFNWLQLDAGRGEGWTYLLEIVEQNGNILAQVGCEDKCIRRAIEPLMDLEEL